MMARYSWSRCGRHALLVLALAFTPRALPLAHADTAGPAQADLGGLHDFMVMAHTAELDLVAPPDATPPMREWLALMRSELSDERYYAMIGPVLARHLTAADVAELGRLARIPVLRREAELVYARSHGGAVTDRFTSAEYAELRRLHDAPALEHYVRARAQAGPELRDLGRTYGKTLSERMWQRAAAEAGRCIAALDPEQEHQDVSARPTGLSYMDRYVAVLVDGAVRRQGVWRAYRKEVARTGLAQKMRGASILAPGGGEAARQAITAIELELEVALKRQTEVDETSASALRQIAFPLPEMGRQAADMQIATAYERSAYEAEQAHRRLALYRRAVALLTEHADRARIEEGKLVIGDADLLAQYQRIWADVEATLAPFQPRAARPSAAVRPAPPAAHAMADPSTAPGDAAGTGVN